MFSVKNESMYEKEDVIYNKGPLIISICHTHMLYISGTLYN